MSASWVLVALSANNQITELHRGVEQQQSKVVRRDRCRRADGGSHARPFGIQYDALIIDR